MSHQTRSCTSQHVPESGAPHHTSTDTPAGHTDRARGLCRRDPSRARTTRALGCLGASSSCCYSRSSLAEEAERGLHCLPPAAACPSRAARSRPARPCGALPATAVVEGLTGVAPAHQARREEAHSAHQQRSEGRSSRLGMGRDGPGGHEKWTGWGIKARRRADAGCIRRARRECTCMSHAAERGLALPPAKLLPSSLSRPVAACTGWSTLVDFINACDGGGGVQDTCGEYAARATDSVKTRSDVDMRGRRSAEALRKR